MKRFLILTVMLIAATICAAAFEYEKVFLWQSVQGMEQDVRNTILYAPKDPDSTHHTHQKNRIAVVVCPGGSYYHLGMSHEGFASARFLESKNIVPFVLRYRVGYNYHHYPSQLQDLQMAIHYLRKNAEKYGIDKEKIGVLGYSAGGHLVTMSGVFGDSRNELVPIGIKTEESVRPNFVMPIYPVVSMQDEICHKWSRINLLGYGKKNQTERRKKEFSMELNVPEDMPPVFLLVCKDDPIVNFENSVRLDKALSEKNVSHVFKVYGKGGHGFGMRRYSNSFFDRTNWAEELHQWIVKVNE